MNIQRHHFGSISSTSDYAKELLSEVCEACLIVSADYQSAGRGRNGRVWQGEFGQNLYFSFAFKHSYFSPFEGLVNYQSASCLAVLNLMRLIAGERKFFLKYPNDVYVRCRDSVLRKISGILLEHIYVGNEPESTVIGIGINVCQRKFPKDIAGNTTSLSLLAYDFTSERIGELLEQELLKTFEKGERDIFESWKSELCIVGKKVRINDEQDGEVLRVNADGSLLVCSANENIRIDNGDKIRYEIA